MGEHLHAPRAELGDGTTRFGDRGLDIVQRQGRDKTWKAVRMPAAHVGQHVIGFPRQGRCFVGGPEYFNRRIGE
jgi:hypothetical protein